MDKPELFSCKLLSINSDGRMPSEFTSDYHVHIIVRQGKMLFSDEKQTYVSKKDDLVIWQMSNTIQNVEYSDDFEADFLIASGEFLSRFNPEMVWASEWITYYATFELVSLLNDQAKTLTEFANLMNFETASHFSRYVKKLLGKSPSEFRTSESRAKRV